MHHNIFESINKQTTSMMTNVFSKFLLENALYSQMEINEENIHDLIALLSGEVKISAYCPACKENRVFIMEPIPYYYYEKGSFTEKHLSDAVISALTIKSLTHMSNVEKSTCWDWRDAQIEETTRILTFQFCCSMHDDHHLDYVVLTNNNSFMKIGQFPSIADLSFSELSTYDKVLDTIDRKEFVRALGLYANGIGAGSYVYLRRIFERLLFKAKNLFGQNIDSASFNVAPVGKKINMLQDCLPSLLIKNPALYGILSKGIHSLSEEECLAFFPVLKDCLFMILNEWESARKKKEDEIALTTSLSKISSTINCN